jgi:hypothetical protein
VIGTTFPLAALIVMLWIVWRDSMRPGRASRVVYAVRIALFLAVAAVVVYNAVAYPQLFGTSAARFFAGLAAAGGVAGAIYFFRLAMAPRRRK